MKQMTTREWLSRAEEFDKQFTSIRNRLIEQQDGYRSKLTEVAREYYPKMLDSYIEYLLQRMNQLWVDKIEIEKAIASLRSVDKRLLFEYHFLNGIPLVELEKHWPKRSIERMLEEGLKEIEEWHCKKQ